MIKTCTKRQEPFNLYEWPLAARAPDVSPVVTLSYILAISRPPSMPPSFFLSFFLSLGVRRSLSHPRRKPVERTFLHLVVEPIFVVVVVVAAAEEHAFNRGLHGFLDQLGMGFEKIVHVVVVLRIHFWVGFGKGMH